MRTWRRLTLMRLSRSCAHCRQCKTPTPSLKPAPRRGEGPDALRTVDRGRLWKPGLNRILRSSGTYVAQSRRAGSRWRLLSAGSEKRSSQFAIARNAALVQHMIRRTSLSRSGRRPESEDRSCASLSRSPSVCMYPTRRWRTCGNGSCAFAGRMSRRGRPGRAAQRRLPARACRLLARRLRLARSGSGSQRLSAIQGAARRNRPPLHPRGGEGAEPDAAPHLAWLAGLDRRVP